MFLGAGVAGAAFAYDGRYPVNLFALLGLLVLLPLIMLLFTLLLLPNRVPGLTNFQGSLAAINPGRWLAHGLDRYLNLDLFHWRAGGSAAARFSKWQLVAFAQWLAVGFYVGALVLAMLLVAFTDLAFGWSTTLEIGAGGVHEFLAALAVPWSGLLPAAVPDAELVQQSRYFRLSGSLSSPNGSLNGSLNGGEPVSVARLGDWWPYVFMVIAVYGMLPRVALLVVATWRLRSARVALLLDDPQVTALLDRIDAPLVQHRASVNVAGQPAGDQAALEFTPLERDAAEAFLIIWNQAQPEAEVVQFLHAKYGIPVSGCVELGSVMSDADVAGALDVIAGDVRRLVVVTKGWEPPLLEFIDLVTTVRQRFNAATVAVVPVSVAGDRVQPEERNIWAQTLGRLSDSNVYVVEAAP